MFSSSKATGEESEKYLKSENITLITRSSTNELTRVLYDSLFYKISRKFVSKDAR